MKKIFNKSAATLGIVSIVFSLLITSVNDFLTGKIHSVWKYVIVLGICMIAYIIWSLLFYIKLMCSKPISVGDGLKLYMVLDFILENEEISKKLTDEKDPKKRKIHLYKMVCNYDNLFLYTKTNHNAVIEEFTGLQKAFLRKHYDEMDDNCKAQFNMYG